MTTRVVNRRVEEFNAYIGRGSRWGNPYRIGPDGDRAAVIALYRTHLWRQIESGEVSLTDLATLDGKRLGCYCAPQPCHGDVLARAAAWAAGQRP